MDIAEPALQCARRGSAMSRAAQRRHLETADEHLKALVDLIKAFGYRHRASDVFSDFVEMAALSLSNAVDLAQRDGREARYLEIVKKYSREEVDRFPQMLGQLVLTYERRMADVLPGAQAPVRVAGGFGDVLGHTYMLLEMGNDRAGQFFTPYSVSSMMAAMLITDRDHEVAEHGFITVMEPTCGAGGMVIATAEAMHQAGHNYQTAMHATCIDIDPRCVHMTYVQLALLNIPAIVILGNSLMLEEREVWYTPAHVLGGWNRKLAARERSREASSHVATTSDSTSAETGTVPPDVVAVELPQAPAILEALPQQHAEIARQREQLSLF